jgi:hypothetical protein
MYIGTILKEEALRERFGAIIPPIAADFAPKSLHRKLSFSDDLLNLYIECRVTQKRRACIPTCLGADARKGWWDGGAPKKIRNIGNRKGP